MRTQNTEKEETNVTSTTNHDSQQTEHVWGYSVQFIWTSTTVQGAVKLQASNDNENWDDITGASYTINDISGSTLFNVPNVFYRFFRPRVEITSGALVTLKTITNIKGF